ncbi:MAG: DUF3016 domain-containing protein [Gammaproteobacteria bacterium]
MKRRLIMMAWLAFAPWPLSATEALRVHFVEPERYTDVGLSGSTTERIRTYVLGELERYLKELAGRALLPSHTLEITVFDLDMAGEYEPWRVPNLTNTRFIRDVYRPRIDLGYVWRDEYGRALAERRERVSDLNYLMLADPYYTYNDPLRYEKAMLRRWFDERFGGGSYGTGTADSR